MKSMEIKSLIISLLSEVLYPKKTMSAHSGVPSEILCRARDYIVGLLRYFTKLIGILSTVTINFFIDVVLHSK